MVKAGRFERMSAMLVVLAAFRDGQGLVSETNHAYVTCTLDGISRRISTRRRDTHG
jgi:hypothetical protein